MGAMGFTDPDAKWLTSELSPENNWQGHLYLMDAITNYHVM